MMNRTGHPANTGRGKHGTGAAKPPVGAKPSPGGKPKTGKATMKPKPGGPTGNN